MAKCVFEDLTSEQAEIMYQWFSGQGEQDCIPWFENEEVDAPMADDQKTERLDNGDVIVHCT